MPDRTFLLMSSATILALLLVGVVGYKLSHTLLPLDVVTVTPEPCDLHSSACGALPPIGGRIKLMLLPRPIPVAAPLEVTVEIEGIGAERVAVDFAGVGMDMGLNRPALRHVGGGRFTSVATLPVCITGRMSWQATVLVEGDGRRVAVPFRFDTWR